MEEKIYENEVFIDYFEEEKKQRGFSTRQICEGLKYRDVIFWENKIRSIDFMLFERLLSRLGIGAEDFHFLLGAKEYDKWHKRICILYAIKTKEYTEAKELLKSYSKQYSKEKSLDKQFVLDMNGIILRVEGGTDEDVIKCLTQAIKQTVNYSKKFDLKNHVLSIPELNIILDLENLKRSNSSVFLEILDYIENKGMDKKGLAKIFPKAAYLYSEAKKKEHITKDDFDCIIDTCNKAIEILRETESMYYLWELLKERELLYKMAPEYECWINDEESIKNSKWLATVECLYEENQVDKESMEHTLLYLSKGVECINDVIMKRRKMLGVSQTSLCHGVCNLRTLQRIEARDTTPTKYVMDQLFQRLGLAEQSKGFSIIIENPSAKELLETCKKLMNCGKYEEANEYFTRLKKETSIDYMQNKQYFVGKEAFLDFSLGIIDEAEYINKLIKGLEFTVPYSCIRREGEKYFTMQEINYLHSITLGCKNHPKLKEEIIVFLENYFSQYMDSEMEAVIAGHFEYIMEKVQSALGNKGDFEKSNAYSKYLIRESLRNRRIFPLFSSLYNIWWNNKEQNGFNPADNSLLERCKDIAEIGKNTEQLHFIEKKIG